MARFKKEFINIDADGLNIYPHGHWVRDDSISIPDDYQALPKKQETKKQESMKVVRVIYNAPATIVIWADGSKTIVKCSPDTEYDPYAGFCAAVAKRLYGSSNAVRKAAGLPRGKQPDKPTYSYDVWADGYEEGFSKGEARANESKEAQP